MTESARREYLGWDLFEPVWSRNTDLDADEALRVAYEQLASARAERTEAFHRLPHR